MIAAEFITACQDAGVPVGVPMREFDARVAALLEVEESTARRWRLGTSAVPGPAAVALRSIARLRDLGFTALNGATD